MDTSSSACVPSTPGHSGVSLAALLLAAWRVWRSRPATFVLLMGIPCAALLIGALTMYSIVIIRYPPGADLREIWIGMGLPSRLFVIAVFLGSLAAHYRALSASVFAAQELSCGRPVGFWRAVRSVRRKQLRLFWIVTLVSAFAGPLNLILFPLLAFLTAPALPVAILENRPAFEAIKRGNALAKGAHGKIAWLVVAWLGLAFAAAYVLVQFLVMLQDRFGKAWFTRPVPLLGLWAVGLIAQFFIVALTVNYLHQREREPRIELPLPAI